MNARPEANDPVDRYSTALWLVGGLAIILFAAILADGSKSFGYDRDVIEMPIIDLVVLLVAGGALFFAVSLRVLSKTDISDWTTWPGATPRKVLLIMIAAGMIARLVLFTSTPALEDDYQRYLWDGAVTAEGMNPYAVAPETVWTLTHGHPLQGLQQQSGPVLERINHPHLTTIYPPMAQAAFAIAHKLQPFGLTAWRAILLIADLATLGLLMALLTSLGRSPLWAGLYWWNPVILKEIFNSAHMDALIFPFLLAGLLMAIRSRPLLATTGIVVAAGVKLWPLLLMPLVWRRSIDKRSTLAAAIVLTASLLALWMAPLLWTGMTTDSGLIAYASGWVLNSPIYKSLVAAVTSLFAAIGAPFELTPSLAARGIIASAVSILALTLAWPSQHDTQTFLLRALIIVTALVFLSPAIYPWYTVWLLPLLVLAPLRGLLLLTITIPLYYCYFYFAAREETSTFHDTIVWMIWVPVWALTLFDAVRTLRSRTSTDVALAIQRPRSQSLKEKEV